jgi:hypothetical protein
MISGATDDPLHNLKHAFFGTRVTADAIAMFGFGETRLTTIP